MEIKAIYVHNLLIIIDYSFYRGPPRCAHHEGTSTSTENAKPVKNIKLSKIKRSMKFIQVKKIKRILKIKKHASDKNSKVIKTFEIFVHSYIEEKSEIKIRFLKLYSIQKVLKVVVDKSLISEFVEIFKILVHSCSVIWNNVDIHVMRILESSRLVHCWRMVNKSHFLFGWRCWKGSSCHSWVEFKSSLSLRLIDNRWQWGEGSGWRSGGSGSIIFIAAIIILWIFAIIILWIFAILVTFTFWSTTMVNVHTQGYYASESKCTVDASYDKQGKLQDNMSCINTIAVVVDCFTTSDASANAPDNMHQQIPDCKFALVVDVAIPHLHWSMCWAQLKQLDRDAPIIVKRLMCLNLIVELIYN